MIVVINQYTCIIKVSVLNLNRPIRKQLEIFQSEKKFEL